jgi:UTP:GlnB (protein PII) uridylyltransferase
MASVASSTKPSNPRVAEFMGSMPASYALAFSLAAIEEHTEIVTRRRGRPVHVERCGTFADRTTVVCVVSDDRTGLLSLICQVLVALHLEVVSAQIYSRVSPNGVDEAIDFFWIRARSEHQPRLITPTEVAALERKLGEALTSNATARNVSPHLGSQPTLDPIPAPRAFFDPTELRDGRHLLVVESRDFPGLLMTITKTLHEASFDVVASEVVTQGWLARDRFLLKDLTQAEPTPERLKLVRAAVLDAVRSALSRFQER